MKLQEIKGEDVDWIHLDQNMVQWQGNESSGSVKGMQFLDQQSNYQFSRRIMLHRVSF
jgi:hypothetical protein